jgi:hypothetical protein
MRDGFHIVRPKRVPHAFLLRQLEGAATPAAVTEMIRDIMAHGAVRWRLTKFYRLSDKHPDRHCNGVEYTHVACVLYKPRSRPGVWECVYGVTSTGHIHLWMD